MDKPLPSKPHLNDDEIVLPNLSLPTDISINWEVAIYEKALNKEANGLLKLARPFKEDSSNLSRQLIKARSFPFQSEEGTSCSF